MKIQLDSKPCKESRDFKETSMLFGDKELDIIEHLQKCTNPEICFPVESSEAIEVLEMIHSKYNWNKWIDSSGKSDPPPDFYSDEYRMMIDVMRVNDTERKGKKGKLHNPTIMRERKLYRELKDKGSIKSYPKAKIFINADTGLSTYEDHNYVFYKKNFARVINKHIANIPLYKKNHPNYKTIFIVYDESTGYLKLEEDISPKTQFYEGQEVLCFPHLFFVDKAFLDSFYNKGIDYLFWFTPYKLIQIKNEPLVLPRLTIYDLSKTIPDTIEYDENKMASSEV
ncbi:MAG: hypothetical protein K6G33_01240 [Ruminococcus sp.]|uniref:hypothetical protein n=1 Tax=Ruminococcus sp. TaxID=41978 RepID=UPI0025F5BCC9|nr:hypothetical protein [Ruminococcus sp.]MCR5599356.1 hypothetical protein [Ruminococcus sp.]